MPTNKETIEKLTEELNAVKEVNRILLLAANKYLYIQSDKIWSSSKIEEFFYIKDNKLFAYTGDPIDHLGWVSARFPKAKVVEIKFN